VHRLSLCKTETARFPFKDSAKTLSSICNVPRDKTKIVIIRKNDKVFFVCRPSSNGASGEDGARFFRPPSSFRALFEDGMPDQARHVRSGQVLVTGGGARNTFLLERMQAQAPTVRYVVPDTLTVDFKEALIFAFLGALYVAGLPNCLASVTGAAFDNIGGCLYKGSRRQA